MELKQRRLGVAWWCGKTAAGGSAGREKAEDGGPVRQQGREEQRQDAARRRPQVREEVGHAAHGGGGEIRARGSVPGAGMEGGAPARRGRRLDAAMAGRRARRQKGSGEALLSCVVTARGRRRGRVGDRAGGFGLGLGGIGGGGWALALGRRGRMGGPGCWAPSLSLSLAEKNREQFKRIKRKAKNKNKMVGHICKALRNISNPTKMVPTK